jgi:penicillin-binding protein 2
MDTESPRLRLSILGIVAFSLFAALFVRLYYLQIMATDEGEVEAANNRVRTIQEEAPRGRLLDAKGRVLVDNRTSLVVTIDPHQLHDLSKADQDDLLLRLAEQLTQSGVPTKVAGIEKRLADPQYSPLQPIPVAIDIPEDLMVFLA